jgi:DtxR family transcriptional regulator, Mn-dependent transcriptional regulator
MSQEPVRTGTASARSTEEQYVEAIGLLEEQFSPVGTAAIAESLRLSMPSVSEMLKRLTEKGLVVHAPYEGAALTDEGRVLFSSVIRRHRLWEVFLSSRLHISWHEVYDHACLLEHATSDLVTNRLEQFLNLPEVCPHGSPIPRADGTWPSSPGMPLLEMDVGARYAVVRVLQENDADCLAFLFDRGVAPGASVRLVDVAEYDGTVTLEVNGTIAGMGKKVASRLRVMPETETRPDASGQAR